MSRPELLSRFRRARRLSEAICAPLELEDHLPQPMADVSPPKWHLGHTAWFFDTFILERHAGGPVIPAPLRPLLNSYYKSVGEPWTRAERGHLSRPTLAEVLALRARVDEALLSFAETCDDATFAAFAPILELGIQHEQQHQELLLMDIKAILCLNPLEPVYAQVPPRPTPQAPLPDGELAFEEGLYEIGAEASGFAFDNEGPRHKVYLRPFALRERLVTSAEWLAFMEAGGYREPLLWLDDGWAACQREGWRAPRYWLERDGAWFERTLQGPRPVLAEAPVTHVSFYEAEAFARWAGARLPTEAEWEVAAARSPFDPAAANLLPDDLAAARLHPEPLAEREGGALRQLCGEVWEWTRSSYEPYPGFQPLAGALGEYNGKFMINQQVLRGGCCATPRDHIRRSYRNFFYPDKRWPFTGLRLARDL